MNNKIMVGKFPVGTGEKPFIVAEVGINHNGQIDLALEMVHVAKSAGCDAVKFQTFKASEFVNNSSQMFTYYSQGIEITESMLGMFQRYELSEDSWGLIKKECEKADILFLSTPQNYSDLELLLKTGISAVKIGSDDLTNLPLLKSYSKCGLPLILSTGMSDLSEVYKALEIVGGLDGYPVILLVCTSQYPTPAEDVNLSRISTLRSTFPMIPIGFSDHTRGSLASSLAVGLGAAFFEKHFTLSHDLPGPDHWFSEDPIGLKEWVDGIRTACCMMGSSIIRPSKNELQNKNDFQRRLVALRDLSIGEIMSDDSIGLRRIKDGLGLPPIFFEYFIGKKSSRSYKRGDPIQL